MNLKEIREIINLMNENDLAEIEVERDGAKLKIKKSSVDVVESSGRVPVEYRIEPRHASGGGLDAAATSESSGMLTKQITSPMVGTFYIAPSPEALPFIEVGQVVEVGQIVCVVEAMKLMNEIKSEIKGKVVEVLVNNAEPVEFGQPLFTVEPI